MERSRKRGQNVGMKDRIDPLIDERAPWLARRWPGVKPVRSLLHLALSYDKTLALGKTLRNKPSDEIMRAMTLRLARNVRVTGLGNIPLHGPALVAANHPTGIADGIMLHHVISHMRDDAYFFANSDILRVLPQMADMIAPVEWRHDKRSHGKTRETMAYVRAATNAGRLGVIFPSGRLAQRNGLRLTERPWMGSAAMLARKYDLPVIPINIQARNSVLFYLLDLIHPTLRDVTLFHETLNKDRQPFRITIGEPINATALPAKPEDGIALLRRATLALGGQAAPEVSLIEATRRPLLRF